ncbi:MAG: phosphopantothenoylcysteine decarboxylase [Chthoniobacterales bacterium]
MRAIVTCGPALEPIDDVRRITNFSTGELGVLLAEELARTGFEVICLRGVAATHSQLPRNATVIPFSTNDHLAAHLRELAAQGEIAGVFHTAALCDYRVRSVEDSNGRPLGGRKIPSRDGTLTLVLEPAFKVISSLREWFPESRLVGWKYELDGVKADAVAKARMQIEANDLDACVANGRAFGPDFGFCQANRSIRHFEDKSRLCRFLAGWLQSSGLHHAGEGCRVAA